MEASSPAPPPIKSQKRHLRLLKNRMKSKDYRKRSNTRTKQLEAKVRELSKQLTHLRPVARSTEEVSLEEEGEELRSELMRRFSAVVTEPGSGQEGIERLMREVTEKFGPRGSIRIDWLRSIFQRTVGMMIPESVLLSLALSDENFSEMRSLLQASLSVEQFDLFLTMQRESAAQRLALAEVLNGFKISAAAIWQHASCLHTMIRSELRPLLQPKQLGRFILWVNLQYADLKIEEVLDYGHNSTEVLNL